MKKRILYLSLLAVIFFNCGGATEFEEDAPHKKPIQNIDIKEVIGFQKAISEIPPSKIIGGLYTGWAKVLRQEYYATGFVEEKFQRTYEDVIVDDLMKTSYYTITKNVVFDTSTIEPRFLVGAIITDGRLNYYLVQSANGLITYENNADALLDIRWELYDTQENKIIYSHKELGTFRDAESDLFAYRESVRIAFRNFLAEKEFIEVFKNHIINFPNKTN